MREEDILSIDQMTEVLDNAPVAVLVSATSDRRLLYTNRLAKKQFNGVDKPGTSCYTVAGFTKPCPFCRAGDMNKDQLKVREYHNPCNNRIYQLSGKLIDWAGEPAHIEYILDITEKKQEEEQQIKTSEELKTTFGSIPCGLCVYKFKDDRILPIFHNPAFYEIMGYSDKHIQSVELETNYLGVHPDDIDLLRQKIEKVIYHGSKIHHIYRIWNDKHEEYRWVCLDGAVKTGKENEQLLFAVYSDVSEQKRLEHELTETNEKMQDIINAIPGGVTIYRVSDIFETMYFSDGVPELIGYTSEEYEKLTKYDAAQMTCPEDADMVVKKLRAAIKNHEVADFEFRKQHKDGHIVWVHIQAKQIGEDAGFPLIQCVFHNISVLRETQMELNHIVKSMPGGIASFQITGEIFKPIFYSDGVVALFGRTREEFDVLVRENVIDTVYEADKERLLTTARAAFASGEVLDVSFRTRNKDNILVWLHMSGRLIGSLSDSKQFYAIISGMSEESRLFQNIANETADGIYVIDRKSFELLYVNESKGLFPNGQAFVGDKCYAALHGKTKPCSFCPLEKYEADEREHEFTIDGSDRFYSARFKETDWNGIPAYIQYIRDITEEVKTRREKERLEMYFQTLVENLPGGVSVIRCESDGKMTPEFISEGFANMTNMTVDEAMAIYDNDIFAGVHPDDTAVNRKKLRKHMTNGEGQCELISRMKCGNDKYMWVKSSISVLQMSDGLKRLYTVYTDISKTVEEKEHLRLRYKDILFQHYSAPEPDTLIVGHCNITQNKIIEIKDYTGSHFLEAFGTDRENFFTGVSTLIAEEQWRQKFLDTYLNAPELAAFERKDTEHIINCFIKLPKEQKGRYAQFKVNLLETPDTGDITGILTVTDITDQTISEKILHRLSVTSHDYVIDLDIDNDKYSVLTSSKTAKRLPPSSGCHSERIAFMKTIVLQKDREQYSKALEVPEIRRRLSEEGSYTITYSMMSEDGDIRTKNMTVSPIDLRLGRVSLVCTDITSSVREQQGLLNMIAYTFDLAGFISVNSHYFTMYTRQMVLDHLPPYQADDYNIATNELVGYYEADGEKNIREQLLMENMAEKLSKNPAGYDFVFQYHAKDGSLRYKQINVMWGDLNHDTICVVRADVTDVLTVERQSQRELEKALSVAEEANRAKSDFLTSMSHDIRTPMNAIMGMTSLAVANLDNRERVSDCLSKITISSKHLLSLINDVLDMSKIESSQITLNPLASSISELVDDISSIMEPQAKSSGLNFNIRTEGIKHTNFYGDPLRINQILINLISNAVKFTPEGGSVDFLVEEIPPVKNAEQVRYRFTVRDTGIGMSQEFLSHIFAPFARERNVSKVEGTGLGLSITRRLVQLMKGTISVESEISKGSVFKVEIEFFSAQNETGFSEKTERQTVTKKLNFSGRCFLIAEDNAINAEILCEILSIRGAKSVVKSDGEQTVHAFQNSNPGTYDAILMDIQMPEMNGYEATKMIRAMNRPDAKSIPIVAMTANAFAEDIQKSIASGMNAHVAKPIDIDLLNKTLSKVLKK